MSKKYISTHYSEYLKLQQLLSAQEPRSKEDGNVAHDEMLFIIVHQVYELWFKQIIHELNSVMQLFRNDTVDEHNIGIAVSRLDRVIEIMKLLIEQIRVMETLTPLDFLDFRNYLFPASGFQSYQFRIVEVMLGLRQEKRITYNNQPYTAPFTTDQRTQLEAIESGDTLMKVIEDWLERIPFLNFRDFDFLKHYRSAVEAMLQREKQAILNTDFLSEEEKQMRLRMMGDTDTYFQSILDKDVHQQLVNEGKIQLSYKATLAALLINLYRDEPILHQPYTLLVKLIDLDEHLTTWRYRHAQMVLRMLGKKVGTGGSSGHEYLRETAVRHHIFLDFHNIATLLIPRSELPPLPPHLKQEL